MKLQAFDVETGGTLSEYALQPFRALAGEGWITSYAIAKRNPNDLVVSGGELFPATETLRKMLVRARDRGVTLVAWNAPFDAAWLIALGLEKEVFEARWLDAMLLYKHITSSPRYLPPDETPAPKVYGLKEAVTKFYPDKAGYEKDIDFATTNDAELDDLLVYNRMDCEHTLTLAEKFWSEMSPAQRRVALIEAQCIPMVAATIVRGITTNTVASTALSKKLSDDYALAFVTLKLTDPQNVSPEVLASPAQLGQLLYDKWQLPVTKLTDGGKPATDKESLGDLADIDERAKLVRDCREALGNRSKFADAVILSTDYNGDGCVRPSPRVFGTYTGRLTYSSKQGRGKGERPTGIALHQWKNGKAYREQLEAPEGYSLLEHDFAGQEFKWMAVESGDETMLGLCEPGEDPHSYMAGRIDRRDYRGLMRAVADGDPDAKQIRKLGKVGNLSLQYRTGHKRLRIVARTQYDVNISEAESRAIHATYRTTYPGVPRYWQRQVTFGKDHGYAETLAGRCVQLGDPDGWDPQRTWSYDSTAINFPIQGVGADQKYLALAVLKNYLPSVDGHFYYELHDGIFTIVPDRYAERAAVEIRELLSNLPYKQAWGRDFPILFPVDAKIGKSWGDLKEIH